MTPLAALAFNGLLACAAILDVRSFRIPNWIPLLLAAAVILHLPGSGAEASARAAAVLLVGVAGAALWLGGLVGGGDYKLIWACSLWLGLAGLPAFLTALGLACGVQGLAALAMAPRAAGPGAPIAGRLRNRVPLALSIAAAGVYWSLLQSAG